MIRQTTDWEKLSANYIFGKGLGSKIYKELSKFNSKVTNSPMQKWANKLNKHLTREGICMKNKHMKRYSTLLVIKEMQWKP